MRLLAMRAHGRVEYVEQQFLAVLDRPVESSGDEAHAAMRAATDAMALDE